MLEARLVDIGLAHVRARAGRHVPPDLQLLREPPIRGRDASGRRIGRPHGAQHGVAQRLAPRRVDGVVLADGRVGRGADVVADGHAGGTGPIGAREEARARVVGPRPDDLGGGGEGGFESAEDAVVDAVDGVLDADAEGGEGGEEGRVEGFQLRGCHVVGP